MIWLAFLLPIIFLLFLLWAEFDGNWKQILAFLLVMGVLPMLFVFWNPLSNLKEWQIGLLGPLFALALIGIHYWRIHIKHVPPSNQKD